MTLPVSVAVEDNTAGAYLVTALELGATCGDFDHGLADLFCPDRGTNRSEEPEQKILAEVRLFIRRSDIVRSIRNDLKRLAFREVEQRVFRANLLLCPHCL